MIGAGRAILADRAAELAEEQDHHTVRQLGRGQVVEERLQGTGQLEEQVAVREELGRVRIIARLERIEDTRIHARSSAAGRSAAAGWPGRSAG